jgi:hypothetical protein
MPSASVDSDPLANARRTATGSNRQICLYAPGMAG